METKPPAKSTQTAPKESKIPSKLRKWLKRIGWTVLGVLVVLWLLGTFARGAVDKLDSRFFVNWVMERRQVAYDKEIEKVRDLYRNDFDGGKTPEETLDLLIEALKKGDIEKASRYWVLDGQKRERLFLEEILKERGSLEKSVEFYTILKKDGMKKCGKDESGDWCMFKRVYTEIATTTYKIRGSNDIIIVPAGEKTTESISLAVNQYTNVWKISQ